VSVVCRVSYMQCVCVEAVDVGINIRRPVSVVCRVLYKHAVCVSRLLMWASTSEGHGSRFVAARKAEHHLAHALNTLLIEIVHTTQFEFVT
jgi:hypothetical protein